MAVCCKPTEEIVIQPATTNVNHGRFLQEYSTGDTMHPQIGYKNPFQVIEDIQSYKWPTQPYIKLEDIREQTNSVCKLTELTGIDPLSINDLCNGSATAFEFMEDRSTTNSERPYFESNFSDPKRRGYCDEQLLDELAELHQSTTQNVLQPSDSFGNGMAANVLPTPMAITEVPMEQLAWNGESESIMSTTDAKPWQNNTDIFGNVDKIYDEQDLLQSLLDDRHSGFIHEFRHSDHVPQENAHDNVRFDSDHQTFTELLENEDPLSCTKYDDEYDAVGYSNIMKPRESSLSNDSGIGGSVVEFSRSPTDHTPGHEVISMSSDISTDQNCYIGNFAPTTIHETIANNQENGTASNEIVEDNMVLSESKITSKKTAYNEKWGVKVLRAWCSDMKIKHHFEKLPPNELNNLLCDFWNGVRKANGDFYGRNSLFNLRAMINKHLKGKPHSVDFDIVTDERFRSSNDSLEQQLKMLHDIGKTITHKEPISPDDFKKMYNSGVLSIATPQALLRKVWFEVTLHFCHKKSEPQEKLTRKTFQIYQDHNFLSYVARKPECRVGRDYDEVRMYATGDERCPVRSFQLYLQKLHPQQLRLFQQPRRKCTTSSLMWYGKAPIGEKALQQMMATISVAANLSKRYTNHCVRTTAIEMFHTIKPKASNRAIGKFALKRRSTEPYIPDTTIYPYGYNNSMNVRIEGLLVPNSATGVGITLPRVAASNMSRIVEDTVSPYSYRIPGQNIQELHNHQEEFYKNQSNCLADNYGQACLQTSPALYPMPQPAEEMIGEDPNQVFDSQLRKKSKLVRAQLLSRNEVGNVDNEGRLPFRDNFIENELTPNNISRPTDFSETIISGGGEGIPEIECISNENFATLSKIIQA